MQSLLFILVILSLESADMFYSVLENDIFPQPIRVRLTNEHWKQLYPNVMLPAWSLSKLMELLPPELCINKHYFLEISKMGDVSTPYEVRYYRFKEEWEGAGFGRVTHILYSSNNLIDACVEMIIKLEERNLL